MAKSGPEESRFPPTRWSILISSGSAQSSIRRSALENLCQAYWPPLYGIARMKGHSREDAQDLLQGYFYKLLTNEGFQKAKQTGGKFRSFLLTGFVNFMRDEWRKGQAQRRGGGEVFISIDANEGERMLELPDHVSLSPEEAFERNWAQALLDQTLLRLGEEFEAKGKRNHFEAMLPFLGTTSEPNYQETAAALGKTVESTRVSVQRFRAAYQRCIRAELAETLETGADLEAELRGLLSAFSKG